MTRGHVLVLLCLALCALPVRAQSVRSLVNGGNDFYHDQRFPDAEIKYRKALEQDQQLVQGHFNLGNSLYRQGKYDEAVRAYDAARQVATESQTRANASYNIGNAWMKAQQPQKAIQAYVDGLKLNPDDQEAKYNLSAALRMLQQQQQQQQQQNKQNKDKQQNKDKHNQQQQQQNKDQQDQQKQQQQQQDQKQDQQQQRQPQQQEKQISKADAERILDVLKNNERDIQKKRQAKPAGRARTDRDW
ncbi:MAG: tetratricopeptide repeat protein [Ignavibacteriae bacterium]|nr:tetratricopeptide repeat protein [Ignavibacteriota bacterium]